MNETKNNELTITQENGVDFFRTMQGFELGQRMCQALATSTLVPQHFQNNIGNCLIALNMANRLQADPLMVMQSLFIVHGKPAFEAKFLIACFNTSGKYTSIQYEFTGEPNTDAYGCYAYAIEKKTGKVLKGATVTIKMAKDEGWYTKSGSKWKTMPELMLQYRAATFFIRTTAPEISLGFHTAEEIEDAVVVEEIHSSEEVLDTEDPITEAKEVVDFPKEPNEPNKPNEGSTVVKEKEPSFFK